MNAPKLALIIGSGLLVTACGGGGSDSPPPPAVNPPPPSGGIGRTGVAIGPISTFGSIVVNGVRYDTSTASFEIDDAPGTQDDLAVGQVVIVKGTIDDDGVNGTADEVIYDDELEGPVSAIDVAAGTFVVLGQTVVVDDGTSFDDSFPVSGIEGIAIDDIVEVSGLFDADGNLVATRIELDADNDDFERTGIVQNLDAATTTFDLGGLVVDYGAALLEGFPNNEIGEGDLVEAEGTLDPNDSSRLLATKVEREDAFDDLEDGDEIELEGFVTRFVDATDFDVAGFSVTTNAATEFEGGTAADLGLNRKIEVEGELDAGGVLVADEIEFRAEADSRVAATVDSVDAAAGTLVVLGIPVSTDALTRFEDQSDADDGTPLTLDDLNVGDYVELRGQEFPADSNEIVASRIERDDPESDVELRGRVDAIAEPSFDVLGVTVETGAGTQFRNANEQPISSSEFFAALATGAIVEAKGTESSDTVIVAEEVELEDD